MGFKFWRWKLSLLGLGLVQDIRIRISIHWCLTDGTKQYDTISLNNALYNHTHDITILTITYSKYIDYLQEGPQDRALRNTSVDGGGVCDYVNKQRTARDLNQVSVGKKNGHHFSSGRFETLGFKKKNAVTSSIRPEGKQTQRKALGQGQSVGEHHTCFI